MPAHAGLVVANYQCCTLAKQQRLCMQTDVILRVTSTAICGSDLHLFVGGVAGVKSGDVLGHEFMGIVEEVGDEVTKIQRYVHWTFTQIVYGTFNAHPHGKFTLSTSQNHVSFHSTTF